MKMNAKTIVAAVAILVVAIGIWWWQREPPPSNVIDLMQMIQTAEKRTTTEGNFQVLNVTIDGETKPAILARPHSRIIYTVTVPPDAWLETAFAMRPESWDAPGDGAQFRIGVSDGRNYEELLRQYINPKRGDRRWFSARLDLSAYEGRAMQVILNTDPGPPGAADTANDEAVWASPRIFSQR